MRSPRRSTWVRTAVRITGAALALSVASCASSGPGDAAAPGGSAAGISAAETAGAAAKNPVPRDERSLALGRALYAKNCQSCHGPRGRGDGPAVGRLNVEVPDLSTRDVQSESDGELFTVITKGSKPMPAYRRLLNEEQRWHVINYVRATFGPSGV